MEYTAAVVQPMLRKEVPPVETYQDDSYSGFHNFHNNHLFGNTPLSTGVATLGGLKGLTGTLVIFLVVLLFIVLPIALHILAIYLAATCNRGQLGNQIGAVVIAVIFPIVYLLFYWIYHTLMGNPCNP